MKKLEERPNKRKENRIPTSLKADTPISIFLYSKILRMLSSFTLFSYMAKLYAIDQTFTITDRISLAQRRQIFAYECGNTHVFVGDPIVEQVGVFLTFCAVYLLSDD
jgi:hypothetical protein